MNNFLEISILLVSTIFDHANLFLTSLSEAFFTPEAGSGVALALAVGAVAYSSISEGVLAGIRKWHGSIDDQFGNIDNLVNLVTEHQPQWNMPPDLYHEDFEVQVREVERQRQEIERLHAELNEKK